MMECGHAANGLQGRHPDTIPCCVVCAMMGDARATTPATEVPDLSWRTARCAYYGKTPTGRSHEGPCVPGEPCLCERPSSEGINPDGPARLAFFEHRPDAGHDRYYCGCWGWD